MSKPGISNNDKADNILKVLSSNEVGPHKNKNYVMCFQKTMYDRYFYFINKNTGIHYICLYCIRKRKENIQNFTKFYLHW